MTKCKCKCKCHGVFKSDWRIRNGLLKMIYDEESTGRLDEPWGLVFWRQVILESDWRFDNLWDTNQKEITKPTTRGSRCVIRMQSFQWKPQLGCIFDVFWQKAKASVCNTRRVSESHETSDRYESELRLIINSTQALKMWFSHIFPWDHQVHISWPSAVRSMTTFTWTSVLWF